MDDDFDKKKEHRSRHSGRKAEKKKAAKNNHVQELTAQQKNPKAFAFNSAVKAHKQFTRTQDLKSKKYHIPVVDRTPLEPPPVVVAVVGGPKVGKSTLMRCLIKNYTRQKLSTIQGPVTVIAGKKRRLTFIEAVNDVNAMIDLAKICDIALLMIDATFGIEMEVFEFLEICRQHGSPRIMGVLNHLDMYKDNKKLKKRKKELKRRFEVELYPGAKLFYLSSILHGEYMKNEVKNLGRFISVMKFRPMAWRSDHPYVLVDRWEDVTNPETVRNNAKCERDVIMYGYVRGIPFQTAQKVHIPGCGDFNIKDISFLPDPCPLPEQLKKRSLNTKERLVYAPMSGVGGVIYDKDAIYIDLGGSHHAKQTRDIENMDTPQGILQPLLKLQQTADEKRAQSNIKLFTDSKVIPNTTEEEEEQDQSEGDQDYEDMEVSEGETENRAVVSVSDGLPAFKTITDDTGQMRRVAIFDDSLNDDDDNSDDSDDDDEEENMECEEESEDDDDSDNEYERSSKKIKYDGAGDSDSDDYDVDAELRALKNNKNENSSDTPQKTLTATTDNLHNNKKLRHNKDADVVSKIQNILSSLTPETSNKEKKKRKKTRTQTRSSSSRSEDSGISDEDNNLPMSQSSDSEPDDNEDSDSDSEFKVTALPSEEKVQEQHVSEDEEEDDEVGFRAAMFKEVADRFYKNQSSVGYLRKFIYEEAESESDSENDNEGDGNDMDGFLKKRKQPTASSARVKTSGRISHRAVMDDRDTSRYIPTVLRDWDQEEVHDSIKNCFVTGEWKEHENAQSLLDMDDEGDLYGDVVDYETGNAIKPDSNKEENEEEKTDNKEEVKEKKDMTAKEKHLEKKRRLKEMFDAEYDDKGSADYFDNLKNEMTQQADLNRKEFENMDDETRVKYEGYRPGLYVRLKFKVFCEFVTNFDANYPVIVGGLKEIEENDCLIRARIKVHRWFPKILKNRDPLYISVGWRRFQTLMYYAKLEDNFRLRSLKYARKYLHIESLFWGYTVASNTGFAAFQTLSNKRESNFRIAATGVVLEADQTSKIVKKLKMIGHPEKIHEKTAFIKGMFNSSLEVARVEGAKLQTQSGIRGIIKKSKGHNGVFRCTFEDTIKMSDVIILKSWAPIKVEKFCSLVRNLLLPSPKQWSGMKTVYEIKKEKNIKNEVNPDNQYTEITERREYIPLPMKVPRKLQAALPYNLKPKITPKAKVAERVIVVKDKEEIKMDNFMKRTKLMMEDRQQRESSAKQERHKKMEEKIRNIEGMKKMREQKKKAFACQKLSRKKRK